jgi:acetylornithine deacetylase
VTIDLAELLSSLVAIPSVNPMGREIHGSDYGESRLTDFLESLFTQMGLPNRRQEVEPGRENITARLDGTVPPEDGGQVILLSVHQDTVPVAGMTIEPFVPQIREGRLYGRGACDVKGGMAAMLSAIARLTDERPRGMPTIVLACTANEECGFSGAKALAETCSSGNGGIIPRWPDAAVVAEPTELDVVVAHKGVVRWRCHTRGVAGHSARPDSGVNAIYRMGHALRAIEQYQREVVGQMASHPLCGQATLSVGTIDGGVGVNTIPDRCTIEIDRRLCPAETADEAYQHAVSYLASEAGLGFSLDHDPPFMEGMALSDDSNGQIAERIVSAVRDVAGTCRKIGVPYATDAAFLAAAGIPTVVFGPGSIQQAHTKDEWIDLEQLEQAAEIFDRVGRVGL